MDSLDEISSIHDDASQSEIFFDGEHINASEISELSFDEPKNVKSQIPVPKKSKIARRSAIERPQPKKKQVEVEIDLNPRNFLAPEFSNYFNVVICFYEAKYNFTPSQLCRNTYITLQFTDEDQEIVTSSYHGTKHAIYNAGFKIQTTGFDLKKWVPQFVVWELGSDGNRQPLAIGFLDFNSSYVDGPICITMKDKWVEIYSVSTSTVCGKVRTSIIFYNNEQDLKDKLSPPVEREFSELEEIERKKKLTPAEVQTENSIKKSNFNTLQEDPFEFTIKVKNEYKDPSKQPVRNLNDSQVSTSSKMHFISEESLLEEPSFVSVHEEESFPNDTKSSIFDSQYSTMNDEEERPKFRSKRVKKIFNPKDDQLKKAADYKW